MPDVANIMACFIICFRIDYCNSLLTYSYAIVGSSRVYLHRREELPTHL